MVACCSPLLRTALSGCILGLVSSLMVNCSLVEVSCSPFFAVAFGLLFLTSSGMMVAQLQSLPNAKNRVLLIVFACLNFLAGIMCFMLERDWSHGLSAPSKVPLYALLGSCLAFSVNVRCIRNALATWTPHRTIQLRAKATPLVCTIAVFVARSHGAFRVLCCIQAPHSR